MRTRRNILNLRGPARRGNALALALCCGGWLVPASLLALVPPTPKVEILYQGPNGQLLPGLPPEVLIGEDFHFKLRVSPPDSVSFPVGYGPFVELYLQYDGANCNQPLSHHCDGLQFQAANTEFTTTVLPLTPCPSGTPFVFGVNPSCLLTPPCPGTTSTPPSCFFGAMLPSTCTDPVAGFQKVVLALPLGSFVSSQLPLLSGQPPVLINVTVHVDSFANDGFPLTVKARGGFQYDHDPSGVTPAVLDPTCPMMASEMTLPRVLRLHKEYLGPEDETATGPNFPVTYQITVDVAAGQTVNNLQITDCLPSSLVLIPSSLPPGSTINGSCFTVNGGSVTGSTTHPDLPPFTFQAYVPDLDTVSGQPVLGSSCKTPVDNQVTAAAQWTPLDVRETGPVTLSAHADHPITAKCIALQKTLHHLFNTNAPGPTPGDVVRYRLDFEVSDFRTFDGIILDDYLADGLALVGNPSLTVSDKFGTVSGNISPASSVFQNPNTGDVYTCNDGSQMYQPTHLKFDISSRLASLSSSTGRHGLGIVTGGQAGLPHLGPATGTIFFRARILDKYLRQQVTLPNLNNVKKDDTLPNCPVISGNLLQNADDPAVPQSVIGSGDDDSNFNVTIVTGILKKSIFLINGNPPPPPPPLVSPGDDVTFRLTLPIPSTDTWALSFDDFPPQPVFKLSGAGATLCVVGPTSFGAGTVQDLSSICPFVVGSPKLMLDVIGPDSLHFDYGTLNNTNNTNQTVDLLVTLTATADPFVDGLHLTNHVSESEKNTFGATFDQTEVAELVLGEPELRIRKGVVRADDPNAVFSPQPPSPSGVVFHPPGSVVPFSGTITSANVGTALNSDVSNVDGCDLVRFVIAVENLGSSSKGAFDVKLKDVLPASCFSAPFPPFFLNHFNLRVVNGQGIPFTCNGGLNCSTLWPLFFGAGITLDDGPNAGALAPYSVGGVTNSTGTNIAIVTFDARIKCNVAATGCCSNTATLLNYAGVEGGPNHTLANFSIPFPDTSQPFADSAQVCIQPKLLKSIFDTSEPSTPGHQVTIGEIVQYQMHVALPVGVSPGLTLTDTLPADMVWMPSVCTVAAAPQLPPLFFSSPFPPPPVFSSSFHTLTFNFGDVTNPPGGVNGALLTVTCNALVLNSNANVAGAVKPNSFTVTLNPPSGPVSFTSNSVPVTIVEPAGALVKKELPPFPGASPNIVFYQLSYTNTGTGTSTAFDVHIHDPLPAPLTLATGTSVTVTPSTCTVQSPPPANLVDVTCPQVAPGGTVIVNFAAGGLLPCVTVNNHATLTYTSLPGLHGTFPNPTGAFTPGLPGAPDGERVYTSGASLVTTRCPDLMIGKTHSGNFSCQNGGTYTITVTNVGNAPTVPPETVSDTLPLGFSFVSGGGSGWTCAAAGAAVTCSNPASIPPGGSSTFTVTVSVQCGGPFNTSGFVFTVVNCANVSAQPEINLANNQSCDPTTVGSPSSCVVALGAGGHHSLAVRNDRTAIAWGQNTYGQLGDGSTADRSTPVAVHGLTIVGAIAGGVDHTLALLQNGTVWAWGRNDSGQLGNGSFAASAVPVQVTGLSSAVAIAAGGYHSLALLANGTVLAWGYNSNGQLGNGSMGVSNVPVQVTGLSSAVAIAGGTYHSLALLANGTVLAWGLNDQGQLGIGTTTPFQSLVPVAVKNSAGNGALSGVQAIAAGLKHSLALVNGGAVVAWGLNANGELGDGLTTTSTLPLLVVGTGGSGNLVTAVSGGFEHSLGLLGTGTAIAWGSGANGELGSGSFTGTNVPVAVSGLTGAAALAAGGQHSLALLADGTVRAWGSDSNGQLGNGNNIGSDVPVPVPCPCTPPPSGLSGWWPFDETVGPIAADLTSAHDNGTYVGAPTPTSGEVGNALCFDGQHDYVDVPAQPQIDFGTGAFTIDLWVRTTAGQGVETMLDKRQSSPGVLKGYSLFLFNGLVGLQMADGAGSSFCSTSSSAACTNWVAPTGNVADGHWHFIAVTVGRQPHSGLFFVDGSAVGGFDPAVRSQSLDNASDLWIGASHANALFGVTYFHGCLDEVEIAKRALQPNEIQAIFASGTAGKCK